jgi:hypothetical protein
VVAIPFSPTTTKGVVQNTSGGRLVNAMAQRLTGSIDGAPVIVRAPGLRLAFETPSFRFRGAIEVGDNLYVVQSNACYRVTLSGSTYTATRIGTVPGSAPVTLARNMRLAQDGDPPGSAPDVLCCHEFGLSSISPTVVNVFTDPDLPDPNSIAFIKSYFLATVADGRFFASGINSTTFAALDFATAENSPDGLTRAVRRGDEIILFGPQSIEFWTTDAGDVGIPFRRVTATKGGIIGTHAVTGWEDGLPASLPIGYVSPDNVVYVLNGYQSQPISTLDVQRQIADDPDRANIRMTSFVNADGCAMMVLRLSNATLVYDARHGSWHDRESFGANRWKVGACFYAFGRWLAGDAETGAIYEIDAKAYEEAGEELIWTVESGPAKQFPNGLMVTRVAFDFATGVGVLPWASEPERAPQVSVSWSDDGGHSYSQPRLAALGRSGQYGLKVQMNMLGRTGHHGRRWRLSCSDPVPLALIGGDMTVQGVRQ